ncbi:cleavage stimulating factor 64 [Rutidosis leptorrhynchoides]|uniref:cleavage stimulating factor 64 n=1 Tax=Rutidosis leptorrhynchoides TaxID=125765 RepID=UPI003A9984E3
MAGNQISGDGLSMNLAGMSKNQLYDIMSQMKTLIEQNQDQARQILIQNPQLTKALFQAQIMLGMLQPPQEIPNIQPSPTASQQTTPPAQQSNTHVTSLPVQSSSLNQTIAPFPSSTLPAQQSNPSLPSHPIQPIQHSRSHNAPSAPIPPQQSSQLPPHYSTQTPSVIQPPMPPVSTPLHMPSHISSMPHMPPLQPPLPPQPRPPSMSGFPHQNYPHMGPSAGYQHPGAPQMHHSQSMFHSGSRPPTNMGPPFSQGPPPVQQPPQSMYQGGSSHVGMDYNQMGIPPSQPERGGSTWMPGLSDNNAVGTQQQLPGPSPPFPPHMGSAAQPPRPASLTADMEKALLQQVMSLTPEQINLLPPDQRNQVLQLQQMLRH